MDIKLHKVEAASDYSTLAINNSFSVSDGRLQILDFHSLCMAIALLVDLFGANEMSIYKMFTKCLQNVYKMFTKCLQNLWHEDLSFSEELLMMILA
jgi:hypothetical protein